MRFRARKSTTDALFALRVLMEKYGEGHNELHCVVKEDMAEVEVTEEDTEYRNNRRWKIRRGDP